MIGQYRVYDAHAHVFPGKIAARAVDSISDFYHLGMRYDGIPHNLDAMYERAGIDGVLIFTTATVAHQVHTINNFIAAKCAKYSRFVGMGCLHPKMDGIAQEIERVCELGLGGIKLHPDFQHFNIDDENLLTMYREIAAHGLPVMLHVGDDRYDASSPERLARVLDKVPDLVAIGAHFGGWRQWECARHCLKGSSAYFDTSSSLAFMSPAYFRELCYELGTDRLMFGTDYPMWDVQDEFKRFMTLGLSEEDNRKILGENFEKLFGLRK